MMKRLITRLRKFRRDDEGSVIAEAVIMFPSLFACVIAMFVFFDAFRNQSINLKAAYTISDALSRETEMITNTYLINTWRMHRFLTNSPTLTRLRVTVIQYEADDDSYSVVWSRNKGGAGNLNNSGLNQMVANGEIPVMPDGEVLILVQTWVDYAPNFSIGLESFVFENTIFTRPRFAPEQVCYSHNGTYSGRICPIGS